MTIAKTSQAIGRAYSFGCFCVLGRIRPRSDCVQVEGEIDHVPLANDVTVQSGMRSIGIILADDRGKQEHGHAGARPFWPHYDFDIVMRACLREAEASAKAGWKSALRPTRRCPAESRKFYMEPLLATCWGS
ncbi:MAG: hypothetical protein ACLQUZ_07225 [Rhizomicrobium sp.]